MKSRLDPCFLSGAKQERCLKKSLIPRLRLECSCRQVALHESVALVPFPLRQHHRRMRACMHCSVAELFVVFTVILAGCGLCIKLRLRLVGCRWSVLSLFAFCWPPSVVCFVAATAVCSACEPDQTGPERSSNAELTSTHLKRKGIFLPVDVAAFPGFARAFGLCLF